MNDRLITLFDDNSCKDTHSLSSFKTDIQIFIEGTDELVFRGSNKVILPGAAFTARSHFNLTGSTEITPSYNTILSLDDPDVVSSQDTNNKCFLFAVGTDGCGDSNNEVYPVDYEKWISTNALVPFRYPAIGEDNVNTLNKYFGKKTGPTHNAYYFKAFENDPVLYQKYITDATSVDPISSVNSNGYYNISGDKKIETYVEINLKITKEDCREYFKAADNMNNARINTISLLTAWTKTDASGNKYYQDIRPLTKLNFPNESLIDLTKGLDIIYHIYY